MDETGDDAIGDMDELGAKYGIDLSGLLVNEDGSTKDAFELLVRDHETVVVEAGTPIDTIGQPGEPLSSRKYEEDVTKGDIYSFYFELTEQKKHELHKRLFVNGWYNDGDRPDEIGIPKKAMGALRGAVNYFAAQNIHPFSPTALPERFMPEAVEKVPVRQTESQIYSVTNAATQNIFGRKASDSEKKLALNLFRKLEDDETSTRASQADVEESLKGINPTETANRQMVNTMNNFRRIIAGAR